MSIYLGRLFLTLFQNHEDYYHQYGLIGYSGWFLMFFCLFGAPVVVQHLSITSR